MNINRIILISVVLSSAPLTAQDADRASSEPVPTEEARDPGEMMPPPVEQITTTLQELEATGHLDIVDVRYAPHGTRGESAVVWTVQVKQQLTYRHALRLLDTTRYVRFRATGDDDRVVHTAVLHYPQRLDLGAADRALLRVDDEFEVWLYLSADTAQVLRGQQADLAVFGRLPVP